MGLRGLGRFAAGVAALLAITAGDGALAGDTTAQPELQAALSPPPWQTGASRPAKTPLPTVISAADADRYRRIFAHQKDGQWQAADALIARVEDKGLLGHVYYQRYMHARLYRARYAELAGWLAKYADHPGATQIHKLALSRKPRNAAPPREPAHEARPPVAPERGPDADDETADAPDTRPALSPADQNRARTYMAEMRRHLRVGDPAAAEKILARDSVRALLSESEIDAMSAAIASGYTGRGQDDQALPLALTVAKRTGAASLAAYWAAGLSAWRLDRLEVAARNFEALALARGVSDWSRAAGGFWAARAYMALGKPDQASAWLAQAAEHRYTFYGLLARRVLGPDPSFGWVAPVLAEGDAKVLLGTGRGWRALALIQAGQSGLAERELVGLDSSHPALGRALISIAANAEMPALAFRLASRLGPSQSGQLDSALYPIPPWTPPEGFAVDPALIYAIMRQESAFNAEATSPAGARGLMQLMPATARFTASLEGVRGLDKGSLYNPELNVALGQRFLRYLLEHPEIEGNLFRLAVAYNAGPGNLSKWDRKVQHNGDPLLFIESLPARETRGFVQRVLANLWIYRMRFGQPSPSLDALAAGEWPAYSPLHLTDDEIARNVED
ncbi:MAG: lytic transglycosylase domain-containing protein [Alphaproteobacteria bacterium]